MGLICKNPYVQRGVAFGCGQCLPCRVNKRRVWAHRIALEAALHEENCFVTLSYADDQLPEGGTLVPAHVSAFLKRLRRSVEPRKVRYYAVGEYGDVSERPHYHLGLFNMPGCEFGLTRKLRDRECCSVCSHLREVWGMGHVYVGRLEAQSAMYIAGYVTKKMTREDDPRLEGRHPEFARMSLKPGIGADMMDEVASTLIQHRLDELEDVPAALAHGRQQWPLGRYLRRRLRTRIGRSENAPLSTIEKMEEELRPLREAAAAIAPPGFKRETFKGLVIDAGLGRRINLEAKFRRRNNNRGTL